MTEDRQALSFSRNTRAKCGQRKPRKDRLQIKEGRRSADRRALKEPHRKAMQRAPFLPSSLRRTEVQDFIEPRTSRSGRARLSAPHRGTRRDFTLGSAWAALPGITGCKREDPLRHQCSEHLAVRHARRTGRCPSRPCAQVYGCTRRETAPAPPQGVPSRKASLRERDVGDVFVIGIKVKRNVALLGGHFHGFPQQTVHDMFSGC